jgi:RNA polymerase sigma-70 factor (ECF subfamily)
MQSEERRLVEGLRAAAPEAVQELSERFGPKLHWFAAARLGGDTHLAEDVMVASLVDAVRHVAGFDPRRATLTAWLYGLARRHIRGELRRQGRRKSVPAAEQVPWTDVTEMPDPGDLAERLTSRLEAQQQVAALAQVLSQVEFEVLVLQCIDELSAREIAHAVGRSERAVHSILHRARRKARERLTRNDT